MYHTRLDLRHTVDLVKVRRVGVSLRSLSQRAYYSPIRLVKINPIIRYHDPRLDQDWLCVGMCVCNGGV